MGTKRIGARSNAVQSNPNARAASGKSSARPTREPLEIVVPMRLVEDQKVHATAKLMYGVLKTFLDPATKVCNPSLVELAGRSGIVLPNVPRHLKHLEAAGYIAINREEKRNRYTFLPIPAA